VIAQLGERQTEDLEVAGSIPAHGILADVLFSQDLMFFLIILKLF